MDGAEMQPVIVMPSVSIDASGEGTEFQHEQTLCGQAPGLQDGVELHEAAEPSVPVPAVSTGSHAAKAGSSTASSPPQLAVERHAQGEQSINTDAMPEPPVTIDGGLEIVDRGDQNTPRTDLAHPHEEQRETARGAAVTEAAEQPNFMQRRAARPQSAPSASAHRRPPSAGRGHARPGSAQSVVRYKVVRPCELRQGCELWTRKLAMLSPGLMVTTRGAKADVSGTARVFCVSPRRGWLSLKGVDGFTLLQRVTGAKSRSTNLSSSSLGSMPSADFYPVQRGVGGVLTQQLHERDAARSRGRPHSAMVRRRLSAEVGRPRQRPSSAHASLQRGATTRQQEVQQQVMVDDNEQVMAEDSKSSVQDEPAKQHAQLSATIQQPHNHENWVLQASSPSAAVAAGGILRRPWERARWFDRAESRTAVGTQVKLRRSDQQKPHQRQDQSRAEGSRIQPAEAVASATAAVVAAERSDSGEAGKRPGSARPRRRPASAKPAPTAAIPNATAGEARRKRGEWRENGRPTSAPLRRSVWVPAATTTPPSPTLVKPKHKKDPQHTSPERTRLQQLQARSALLQQQQSVEQATDVDLASLVLQQESLESLAPWGGLAGSSGSPGSPGSYNSSTGWRGVVP